MKKLATTFGLLALMLIVTSFTTPEIGGNRGGGKGSDGGFIVSTEIGGNQGGGKGSDGGLIVSPEIGGNQGGGKGSDGGI